MDLSKDLLFAIKKKWGVPNNGMHNECEALIGRVLENMVKSRVPNLQPDVKNDEISIRLREEGNQCFVMGDDEEAIEKYTMSLCYATSEESKSMACANRSAALYRKKLYHQCLIDIDAALTFGYPEEKRKKLRERAHKAIEGIRELFKSKDQNMNDLHPSKAVEKESNNSGISNNNNNNNNNNEIGEVADGDQDSAKNENLSLIREFFDEKVKSVDSVDEEGKENMNAWLTMSLRSLPRYAEDGDNLNLAYGPSKECPAFSDGVRISYSDRYGRHMTAVKSFQTGDMIAMEKPFVHVVYRETSYAYCNHCLSRSYNLIPCSKCPISQYCSEKCKTEAWNSSHRIECPVHAFLSNLLKLDKDKIRIFTKILRFLMMASDCGTGLKKLRDIVKSEELDKDIRNFGFTEKGMLESHSTRSALSLATNLATRPITEISAFACISVLVALLLSTETEFFGTRYKQDKLSEVLKNDEVRLCATVLFRAAVIESSNSFSIQQDGGVKCGSGLYVGHSLLNHSCAPNTFRHFDGLTMITRALQPIREGEQIFTCYGATYPNTSRSARRAKMSEEYFFDCECEACEEDWPMYPEILRRHVGSIFKSNRTDLAEKIKPFRQRLMKNKYDVVAVKNIIDSLFFAVKLPCEEIVHAQQYLKSYYLVCFLALDFENLLSISLREDFS